MDSTAVKLAPSILAADFARLGDHVTQAERAGADRIHIDVMDGHFVPNLSMGIPIVASLAGRIRRDRALVLADRAAAGLSSAEEDMHIGGRHARGNCH